jgi:hypothetical protein
MDTEGIRIVVGIILIGQAIAIYALQAQLRERKRLQLIGRRLWQRRQF